MNDESRSTCPIACTLDLIGDRWTLLVLRDLFLGKSRYDEFLESPEGISTNVLADRLKRLETEGMVVKEPYSNHRRRMAYSLTSKGKSLGPILRVVADWGLQHLNNTALTAEAERLLKSPSKDRRAEP